MPKYVQILPGSTKVHWKGEYSFVPNFHPDAGTFICIDGVSPEPGERWDYNNGSFEAPADLIE